MTEGVETVFAVGAWVLAWFLRIGFLFLLLRLTLAGAERFLGRAPDDPTRERARRELLRRGLAAFLAGGLVIAAFLVLGAIGVVTELNPEIAWRWWVSEVGSHC